MAEKDLLFDLSCPFLVIGKKGKPVRVCRDLYSLTSICDLCAGLRFEVKGSFGPRMSHTSLERFSTREKFEKVSKKAEKLRAKFFTFPLNNSAEPTLNLNLNLNLNLLSTYIVVELKKW